MRRSDPTRRTVLAAAAILPAALLWRRATSASASTAAPRAAAARLFSDTATARTIGARYLAQSAGERDPATLAARLPAGCADPPRGRADADALRRALGAQRRRDFAAGDTVIVDGWVLARSEARLCALAALGA